jgi:hypothetical protein
MTTLCKAQGDKIKMTNYLEGLNDKQREAVLHVDGPLMIVAVPAVGKRKYLQPG